MEETNFYSLLEILEAPKRLNNIPKDKIFDYLLESTNNQERFEMFMDALEHNYFWAYFGICLMCTDMVDIKDLFEEEFKNAPTPKFNYGSSSEYNIFNLFVNYLSKGLFQEKKYRTYYVNYLPETLSVDEYNFCITCLKQIYKKEVYPCIKIMHEHGKLREEMKEFFSYCMDDSADKTNQFTSDCLILKTYSKFTKVGGLIFKEGKLVTDKNIYLPLLNYVKEHEEIPFPNICEVFTDGNEIFMFRGVSGTFVTKQPNRFNDSEFINLFYNGFTTFVCVRGNTVTSIISKENGFLKEERHKVKSFKRAKLPLLIIGMNVDVIICELEDGTEISAFVPSTVEKIDVKKALCFTNFNGTYYLKGV